MYPPIRWMTSSNPPIPPMSPAALHSRCFNRRKRFHEGDKLMADITADHIIRHLDNSGFVIMKKPPALGGGDNPGLTGKL